MRAPLLPLAASVLFAVAGCSRAPIITVRNQASLTLSNVVVSGTGFSEPISMLPSGVEHQLRVKPQGESGVRLTFDAGGQRVDSGIQGYIEPGGGYRVRMTVGTNLNVSIEAPSNRQRWARLYRLSTNVWSPRLQTISAVYSCMR